MWPGMRPATGMDRVEHLDVALLQGLRHLAHRVLRLRDRHAVARHDDDLARVVHEDRDVGGARRAHRAARLASPTFDRGRLAAEAAEQHAADRAVHGLRHLVGEDRARRADDHAGDDQRGVVERDARRGRAQPRERVQRRDHDRHVRAADRQHGEVAEDPGRDQDEDEEALARRAGRGSRSRRRPPRAAGRCSRTGRPGIFTGLPEMRPWSLPNAMFEPQKEIEPMIAPKIERDARARGPRRGRRPAWRNSAQAISATAPPPTPLNSATICGICVIFTLRALGTPTAVPIARPTTISRKSAPSSAGFSSVATTAIGHADGGDLVALDGGRRARQPRQADDEQRERDDVHRGDEVRVLQEDRRHGHAASRLRRPSSGFGGPACA